MLFIWVLNCKSEFVSDLALLYILLDYKIN